MGCGCCVGFRPLQTCPSRAPGRQSATTRLPRRRMVRTSGPEASNPAAKATPVGVQSSRIDLQTELAPRGDRSLSCACAALPCLRRGRMAAHVGKDRGRRPAIELYAVCFLIGAERGPRLHAGLAVDLVLIEAARSEDVLHRLDIT